ncbi:hypothetical protein [Bacillus sp. OAE603]|uniref:hypothetical protein n=1 Tax=Gottfriedia sp. OAE603 TaxID=2663872 RepID=UPI00178BA828
MKKKLIIFICIIGIIGIGYYLLFPFHFPFKNGYNIEIINDTGKNITGLSLTNVNVENKIPIILDGDEYKFKNVTTTGFYNLEYKDHNGDLQTIPIVGFEEKGSLGEAVVTLESINENGIIESDLSTELRVELILK